MKKETTGKHDLSIVSYESLEAWARSKVQEFLQDILEEEVSAFLGRGKSERREEGNEEQQGYRNGHGKPRKVAMLSGTLLVQRPRVRDTEARMESRILPLFKRRTRELGELLPELYLHGLAQGDFELALRGLLGEGAPLSASSIARLKAKWQLEYDAWKKQDLSGLEVVYMWADGLYVKAGLEAEKAALLVIVAGLTSGEKVVLACESGQRESKESWLTVLRDLKERGLKPGKMTVADGHLGIWSALGELHAEGKEQRCWNHKITNVLDKLPQTKQAEAKELLRAMMYAETRADCEKERDTFVTRYEKNYPKATETLLRDWDRMVTLYEFPKEHWIHLRTTNIVESPFAAVRLRTDAAKRYKKVENATAMIWKLLMIAEKTWRKLNSPPLLKEVYAGKSFVNGVAKEEKSVEKKEAA